MADEINGIDPTLLDFNWNNVQLDDDPFAPSQDAFTANLASPPDVPPPAETSISPMPISSSSSSEPTFTPPEPAEPTKKAPRLRPIPRKGHTKSRRGCFNCKRRKIKCAENFPSCHHCEKAGLICEYPKTPVLLQRMRHATAAATPSSSDDSSETTMSVFKRAQREERGCTGSCMPMVQMSGTPGQFGLQDMRFFHHFLMHGYPHLPIGADKVWVTTIPAIAHQYDYLTHAILGLAASQLSALSKEDLSAAALSHRLAAMSCFNNAISSPARSRQEADARMATTLALTFQSVHFEDNYAEFLTMNRGCFVIGADQMLDDSASAFWGFRTQENLKVMAERLGDTTISPCSPAVLDEAVAAVEVMKEICTKEYELEYIEKMLEMLRYAYSYPELAYQHFTTAFSYPSTLPEAHFQDLIRPANIPGQLLLALWLGVQFAMVPILIYEYRGLDPSRPQVPTVMNDWIGNVVDRVGGQYKRYWAWPAAIVKRPWQSLFAPRAVEEFAKCWASAEGKGRVVTDKEAEAFKGMSEEGERMAKGEGTTVGGVGRLSELGKGTMRGGTRGGAQEILGDWEEVGGQRTEGAET